MNFFKGKVLKYQEKKLVEAKQKLKFHTEIKTRLENELNKNDKENPHDLKKEIERQQEFIEIWEKNVESITKQLKKLNS